MGTPHRPSVPREPQRPHLRGEDLYVLGRIEEGKEALQRAASQAAEDDESGLSLLHQTYVQGGWHEDAIATFEATERALEAAVQARPGNTWARVELSDVRLNHAHCLTCVGRLEEAHVAFEALLSELKALRSDYLELPAVAQVQAACDLRRSSCFRALGRIDEADATLQRCVERWQALEARGLAQGLWVGEGGSALIRLAWHHAEERDYAAAATHARAALDHLARYGELVGKPQRVETLTAQAGEVLDGACSRRGTAPPRASPRRGRLARFHLTAGHAEQAYESYRSILSAASGYTPHESIDLLDAARAAMRVAAEVEDPVRVTRLHEEALAWIALHVQSLEASASPPPTAVVDEGSEPHSDALDSLRETLREDEDFAPLRDLPAYRALLGD